MKSLNNKTEYEDDLFYQAITACLSCIFISPIDSQYELKLTENKNQIQTYKMITEKMVPVKSAAAGKITEIIQNEDKYFFKIEHKNQICTTYGPILKPFYKTTGIQIKQGEELGFSNCLEYSVQIPVSLIIKK